MFRKRSRPIDWNVIAEGRSTEAIMRDPSDLSVSEIQTNLENITFGKIRTKSLPDIQVIIKGFECAQLTIEYLLNVQESLSSALNISQRELDEERSRSAELEKKEKKSRSAVRKLKECQTTLQAASYMLNQFGVETTPLRKMCEDGARGAKAPEYVWVPAFLDPYDGKSFQSAEYLKKHMFSRNLDSVKADLNSGKYCAATDYDLANLTTTHKAPETQYAEEPAIESPPNPRDEIEAASQRLTLDLGGSVMAHISRKALLKELQFLKSNPQECHRYHFQSPVQDGEFDTTIHDMLHCRSAVNALSEVNASIMLDWRAVDAHLRTLHEMDLFLRTDLERKLAGKIHSAAQEANNNFEMKQIEDLDSRALKLFKELDTNGDGNISLEEFLDAVVDPSRSSRLRASLGFKSSGEQSSEEDQRALNFIRQKMNEIDTDGDGLVSKVELKSFMERVSFFNDGFNLGQDIGFSNGMVAGEKVSERERVQHEELKRLWDQRAEVEARESALIAKAHAEELANALAAASQHSNAMAVLPRQPSISESSPSREPSLRESSGKEPSFREPSFREPSSQLSPTRQMSRQYSDDDDDRGEFLQSTPFPEAIRLFSRLDMNGDGKVSMLEFSTAALSDPSLCAIFGFAEGTDTLKVMERAKLLDEDGDGYLSFEEVGRFIDRSRAFSLGYDVGVRDCEEKNIGASKSLFMSGSNASEELVVPPAPIQTTDQKTTSVVTSKSNSISGESELLAETDNDEPTTPISPAAMATKDTCTSLEELPEPSVGELWFEFSVVAASNLRPADKNGLSDPLAVVKVNGKELFSTKCIGKTLYPRWAVNGDEGMVKLIGLDLTDDSLELTVELWDQDGIIFHSRDFLGMAVLKRKHILDPSYLGQGVVSFPLVPGKEKGREASLGITGTVDLCWRAKATVRLGLLKAEGLRHVERRGLLGGSKPPAAPKPFLRFSCQGCRLLDVKGERNATCAHIYSTSTLAPGSNPSWNEFKSLVVPLDRFLDGALLEAVDGPSGQVLGEVRLSPEMLLCSTPGDEGITLALQAPKMDDNKESHNRSFTSLRTEGKVTFSIGAPPGLAEFYNAGKRNTLELTRHAAAPLECMEVEVECLRASGLAAKKEAFVKVLLNGVPVGRRSKARPTSLAPTFSSSDGNRFVVNIPFPKELASLTTSNLANFSNLVPETILTVQLWDENKITRNELLGEVELRWPQLVHPSLKSWPLSEPRVWHHDQAGVLKRGARAHAGAQGMMKLRLRQLQCFQVTLVGAYGLRPADGGHNSDPFAELKLSREGDTKPAKGMRTAVVPKSLEPVWLHHFMFSKSLDPTDASIDKHERKRRREVCKSVKPSGEALFPGLWAETTGGSSMVSACTTFQSYAVQGDRLLPADPADPKNGLRPLRNSISLEICVWDKDDFSSNDFLGVVTLSESQLRQPKAGISTLRLEDDSRKNKEGVDITGWVEVMVRSSVSPEVVEREDFQRLFPPPDPDIEPVIGVRFSNLKGNNLNPADTNGKSDPYAVLTANGVLLSGLQGEEDSVIGGPLGVVVDHCLIGETEVLTRTLNPAWKSTFEVLLPLVDSINPHTGGTKSDNRESSEDGEAAKPPGSSVDIRIFDKDTIGSDDFLGYTNFEFDELLGIKALPSEGKPLVPDPDQDGKEKKVKKRSFEFFSCRYIDILPPAGFMNMEISPLGRLHLTLIGARGLVGANMNGLSDPYIRIRCSGGICPYAGGREGFFRLGGGRKVFKTAVRSGTLNPTWNETVVVPLDLRVLFTSRENDAALSIEVWDEPTVTSHKFLGRVLLDAFLLSRVLTKPQVAPQQCQLTDAPETEIPKQKKLKKPISGFLEFHVSGSEIPEDLRVLYGCDTSTDEIEPAPIEEHDKSFALPTSPDIGGFTQPVTMEESMDVNRGMGGPPSLHRPSPTFESEPAAEEDSEYLEEQARVELMIREAARLNLEARQSRQTSGTSSPQLTPPDIIAATSPESK